MPQTESSIEQSFVRWCKKHGINTFKLALRPGRGWPDRAVLFRDNRTCWLEFKKPGGRLSEGQKFTFQKMNDVGHEVSVVWSLDDAKKALAEFAKRYETSLLPADGQKAPDRIDLD